MPYDQTAMPFASSSCFASDLWHIIVGDVFCFRYDIYWKPRRGSTCARSRLSAGDTFGHWIGDVLVRFSAQMIASILKGRLCLPFRSLFAFVQFFLLIIYKHGVAYWRRRAEFMHSLSCASSEDINVFASFAELQKHTHRWTSWTCFGVTGRKHWNMQYF